MATNRSTVSVLLVMITFVPFRRKFDGHVVAIAAAFIEKDLPVHIGRAFQVSI